MSQYQRSQPGQDSPPHPHPAPQPHPPGTGDTCKDLPTSTPPTLEPPAKCPPDPDCNCPLPPGSNSNCLEDLIAAQTAQAAAGEKATTFKADLVALVGKAKTASQEYTRTKYEALVKEWVRQDGELADLIRKLVCAVPCWRCVIECHICPILNELHYAEQWLYGTGAPYSEVHNLNDLLYWHSRDKDAKDRRFQRVKKVLEAWEKPAQTIEKILADDSTLIGTSGKALGSSTDASKAVYDVFLKLVPMHLAIAPPSGSAWTTKIGKEYTEFCACDKGSPDDCCGPDVGEWSLRQRLIGPQPYLIDPNDYFEVICCLVEKRYAPAKDALAKAEADYVTVENQIKRFKGLLDEGLKPGTFEKNAKDAIPSVIDCGVYETDEKPSQTR